MRMMYMNDKPLIKLFRTNNKYYMYDVNKNNILKINRKQYNSLENYLKDNVDYYMYSEEITEFYKKGFLSSNRVNDIDNPHNAVSYTHLPNIPLERRRTMNKTKLKCPRCHSDQLYKFGLDKQANQKYQCKNCKRQFVAGDDVGRPKRNYPKCPKCGKATYLHHQYKHYNRYKCGNLSLIHISILLVIIQFIILLWLQYMIKKNSKLNFLV